MPKQRNRQHHHAKSGRHDEGLQLPTQEQFFVGDPPRIFYPRGWKTKWPGGQPPIMLGMLAIMGIVVGALILLALVATFLFR